MFLLDPKGTAPSTIFSPRSRVPYAFVRCSPITLKCLVHIDLELVGMAGVLPAVHRHRPPRWNFSVSSRSSPRFPIDVRTSKSQFVLCLEARLDLLPYWSSGRRSGGLFWSFPFSDSSLTFSSPKTAYHSAPGSPQNSSHYTLKSLLCYLLDFSQSGRTSIGLLLPSHVRRELAPFVVVWIWN